MDAANAGIHEGPREALGHSGGDFERRLPLVMTSYSSCHHHKFDNVDRITENKRNRPFKFIEGGLEA